MVIFTECKTSVICSSALENLIKVITTLNFSSATKFGDYHLESSVQEEWFPCR